MSCGKKRSALLALISLAGACATAPPPRRTLPIHEVRGEFFEGKASWYGHSQTTASGERFDRQALTAAHRTLPMQTRVRCTNQRNGKSVVVRINDRGPYGRGRVIDLSEAAAAKLDMIDAGVVPVRCEVLR